MKLANLFAHLAAVALGALAAEGFVRSLIEPDAMFENAFSPGAQQPHEVYGSVYTPNFEGYMRHPDNVWSVPVALDEHGFRPAARSAGSDPVRVAIVAGRSMTMCYGLPWEKTIQARMVELYDRPMEVVNTGWAGFDPYRSWHYFLETFTPEDEPFDVVFFCYNPGSLDEFAWMPEDFSAVKPHPLKERFFYMMPGIIRMPKDRLEEWMGPAYFSSYVANGLLRYRKFARPLLDPLFGRLPSHAPEAARQEQADYDDPAAAGRKRYVDFAEHMQSVLAARGTQLVVTLLPSMKHPVDFFAEYDALLPPSIERIDLQRLLREQMQEREFIADMHYSGRHAELIATELNRVVDELVGP